VACAGSAPLRCVPSNSPRGLAHTPVPTLGQRKACVPSSAASLPMQMRAAGLTRPWCMPGDALLQLPASVTNWADFSVANNLKGWLDVSVPLCQWSGVQCDADGRVTALCAARTPGAPRAPAAPRRPALLSSRARRQAARLHAVHGARGGDAAGRAGRPGPPDLARAQLQLAQRHAAGRVRGRLPRAGRAAPGLQRVHGQPAGRVAGHARRPAGAAVARAGGQPAGGRAAGRGARRAGQPAEPGPAVEPARGARPPAAPTRSSPAWEGWRQGSVAGRTRRAAARAARERRPSRPGPTGPALGQPPRTLGPGAAPGAGQAGCAAGLTI